MSLRSPRESCSRSRHATKTFRRQVDFLLGKAVAKNSAAYRSFFVWMRNLCRRAGSNLSRLLPVFRIFFQRRCNCSAATAATGVSRSKPAARSGLSAHSPVSIHATVSRARSRKRWLRAAGEATTPAAQMMVSASTRDVLLTWEQWKKATLRQSRRNFGRHRAFIERALVASYT
jgi:hypothetical protein